MAIINPRIIARGYPHYGGMLLQPAIDQETILNVNRGHLSRTECQTKEDKRGQIDKGRGLIKYLSRLRGRHSFPAGQAQSARLRCGLLM